MLIPDARYPDKDFATYKNRGNPSPLAAVRAADEAGVRKLILFNNDAQYGSDTLGPAISELRQKLLTDGNPLEINFAVPGGSFFA